MDIVEIKFAWHFPFLDSAVTLMLRTLVWIFLDTKGKEYFWKGKENVLDIVIKGEDYCKLLLQQTNYIFWADPAVVI